MGMMDTKVDRPEQLHTPNNPSSKKYHFIKLFSYYLFKSATVRLIL